MTDALVKEVHMICSLWSAKNRGKVTSREALNYAQIQQLKIPRLPLATQQPIVAKIEAEQTLVATSRELITRFEKKIQVTLARIWGEAA